MAGRSNKSIAELLAHASSRNDNELLEKKINTAAEGFATKFCELILRDRNRLSKENALTVSDYIIAMKREVNPRLNYKKFTMQIIAELSKTIGIAKKFIDMTRDDLLSYLDKCRKQENEDPLHKWIGSYNTKLVVLSRFFKWLYYPHIDDPKRRSELSALERKLDCIMGIRKLKRKVYKYYKEEFFPKLLKDNTVTDEDKEKIKSLLAKPFNPYVRRHSALTEKSIKLKSNILNQHAGWSTNSNMAQKYIHYFGNESSESLLEAYGIVTNNNIPIDRLNPKICPNCNEGKMLNSVPNVK
jgi:hypothetical protein